MTDEHKERTGPGEATPAEGDDSARPPEPYAPLAPADGTEADPLADPGAIDAAMDVEAGADELAKESTGGAEAVVGRWGSQLGRLARTILAFVAFFLIVAFVWELFKWLFGDPWRFENILGTGWDYMHMPPFELLQASDRLLPHIWDIAYALTEEVRGTGNTLLVELVGAAISTWTMAVIGFAIGTLIGVTLASIFVHSALSERAFMPYVIASQAIPIVALAPIIVVAAGRGNSAVVIIAVYLTFFPVTVAQSRGLRSPDPRSLELMRSMAASRWDIYRKVRLPASLPYLFTALKIAAAAAIVGAIVGEGPGGVRDGLGRALLNYAQYYSTGPERLWATILIASLTGIFFFTCVRIAEIISTRRRRRTPDSREPIASSAAGQGA